MSTKPSSRRRLRLILGAVAVLIPLTAIVLVHRIPTGGDRGTGIATVTTGGTTKAATDGKAKAELTPEVRRAGADESWWQAVSAGLEREEYAAQTTSQGLQAPNRAHNLRTTFGDQGIEVVPRTGKDIAPAWRFTWATTGFGRPGHMQEASPSAPSAAGARVVYQHDGWSEWYENTAKGLEQGFTIERRPEGEGPLQIAGTFPEALRAEMREDGAVDFLDEHGACAIRYGELHVWDANGREIDSRLAVYQDALAILIEDEGAIYPLIVDPLMTSPAWTAEGNQTSAYFGVSVATAGDVNGDGFSDVIVGAYYYDNGQTDEGRAFVYHGSAAGLATTPAWTAESNQANTRFGYSVATAGDVNGDGFSDVIVGAYSYVNGETNEGRAFVYHGSAAGLAASAGWTAEGNQVEGYFGYSVATAGDVNGDGFSDVIVGAFKYDNGESDEGRAFAYHGSAAGLSTTPAWTAESNQAGTYFGVSVATAGDVNGDSFSDVIVGAYYYDNGQTDEGRAFAYHGSAAGLATTPVWTAESNQADTRFGYSVATAGDVNGDGFSDVIVGAYSYANGETNEGRAFVYHGSAAGLAASAGWTAEGNQVEGYFGISVATAGDVNGDGFSDVIVGAYGYDNGQLDEGRAFAYLGSAAGLSTTPAWTVESNQAGTDFGISVATAGDVNGDGFSDVIVGANSYDNGQTDEGRAFVYHGSGAGIATTSSWMGTGQPLDVFGASVATAGDVNGDGYSDIIAYVAGYDNGQTNEGQALVYHGSATGPSTLPAWALESDQDGASDPFVFYLTAAATAGDVNGDGFSDVIVGFNAYDNDQVNEGRAFVYYGSTAGLATTSSWTAESNQVDSRFGHSVATAGDVNGDGFSDVLVGAFRYDNGQTDEGRAYAYYGSPGGLASTPAWTAESNSDQALFGIVVATAGDLNADGFSDVIVGAPYYSNGNVEEGAAFVYLGSASGLATTTSPPWTVEGEENNESVGFSAGTAGDFNGDGFSDLVIGFLGHDYAQVYTGSPSGLLSFAELIPPSGSFFGESIGTAGDVNGDGLSDVIVCSDDNAGGGTAYVYHGNSIGGFPNYEWYAHMNGCCGQVATAGDVNGDGFSDIIVGDAHGSGNRAFVHLGNAGDGLDRIPRQTRTDDSAPIWPLANSDSESAFRLKVLGRTAAGRGDVRLQFEVKPAGVAFDGTGLVTGSVTDTGVPTSAGSAVPLSQLAIGLSPETLYHWRLRVLSDSPFFPGSPWMWLPYNGATEADVRTKEATTAVGGEEPHPTASLWLAPGAPNPFNPRTTLSFLVPARTPVRLAIHDVQGRLVRVLVDEVLPAGQHQVEWDGRDGRGQELATGVYLSRLEAGGEVRSRKLALVK